MLQTTTNITKKTLFSIIDKADSVIAICDVNGKILFFNDQFEILFSHSLDKAPHLFQMMGRDQTVMAQFLSAFYSQKKTVNEIEIRVNKAA